ncbi:MAG: M48 family metalloprotease [Deltaproteobacteria bacterium]|nr:M48 family metalloprotease [Deltaproteobacteria bacterium]
MRYPFCVVIFLFVLGCAINPVTGEKEFVLVSEERELEMGAHYFGPIVQSFDGVYPDEKANQYIQSLGEKIASISHRPGLRYEFKIVNSPIVNAFALPGGKICVTRGLLSHMDREDQLVAVLGHELGHVTARHQVRAMSRQMLIGTLFNLGAIAMEVGQVQNRDAFLTLGAIGLQAGLAKYSRDQESQADELGMQYLMKLHHDPHGAIEVFEVFQKLQQSEPSTIDLLFSSHPQSKDRIANMKVLISTTYALELQGKHFPSSSTLFQQMKARIKKWKPYYEAHDEGVKAGSEGLWNTALEKFKYAVQGRPEEAVFQTHLAYAYSKKHDEASAVEHFQKAMALYPQFFKPKYFMGMMMYEYKKPQEAIRYLLQADEIIPGIPLLRLVLGESFEQTGNIQRAIDYYVYVYQNDSKGRAGKVAAQHLYRLGYFGNK